MPPQTPPNARLIDLVKDRLKPLHVLDVGAMWLGEEHAPFSKLIAAGHCRVTGFEPLKSECDKLNAMNRPGHTYLPYFIGDGSERTFHITNTGMTSSLYPPNYPYLNRFMGLAELIQVTRTEPAQTTRLDDIPDLGTVDCIKLDVQGAEIDVLNGAERTLKDVVAIETEVEFIEMYKGQPLFAEVDQALRARGFAFYTFMGIAGRCLRPFLINNNPYTAIRQQLWANALYIRDDRRFSELSPDQLLKLAVILVEQYAAPDMAALALQYYDAATSSDLRQQFLARLFSTTLPVPPTPL